HDDRRRVVHLRVGAELLLEEDRGHRAHVLVGEAPVRPDEAAVAGLDPRHTGLPLRRVGDPAPGEDLLRDRHRAWTTTGAGRRSRVHAFIGLRGARASAPLAGRCGTRLELRLEWRDRDLALEPRDVVLEE